jgi:hypothetical protein
MPHRKHRSTTSDNRARQSTDLAGSGIQATGVDVFFYLYRCLTDVVGGVSEQATFNGSSDDGERSGAPKTVTPCLLGTAQCWIKNEIIPIGTALSRDLDSPK